MKRMLFNATYQEELRVASVEGQKLINFDIETTSKEQRRGNIYKGVVTRVEPSLEACFVDYGTGKQGFLPFKEIDNAYLPQSSRFRDFGRLPEGTELIIQVEKDERGNKGAALTTYVSLPGRYLVLMPNNSRSGGISRRIDGEERDELKAVLSELEVPAGMSVIARTAALGRIHEELQWDLSYLLRLWDAVKNAWHNQKGSFLIYQESNLVIRSIRDHFSPDVAEVLIDVEDIYEQAQQFMANVMPSYVDRVKLYRDDVPLFSRFQIEHQIETAYSRAVNLPSGGSIVIDHTEALTAVDVNSGKSNKGADIEATALTTNMEAAEEIARQLRLRDLGGLVVVDFIDMENPRNQREVENCFKQQLGLDRARIQMGKLSKFGLLELSRQRLQASLEESTTISCPRCAGTGVIRGTESIAIHILRIIQEDAVKNVNYIAAMHVQLPVEVATYLLNEKRDDVAAIERRMKVRIVLIPNVNFDSPHYKIRKIMNDGYENIANKLSYNLVEQIEDTEQNYTTRDKKNNESVPAKAVVKHIAPQARTTEKKSARVAGSTWFTQLLDKSWSLLKSLFNPVSDESTTQSNVRQNDQRKTKVAGRYNQQTASSSPVKSALSSATGTTSTPVAARTRPVGVNKSNTRIQTVRQTPTPNRSSSGGTNAALNTNNKSILMTNKNIETKTSDHNVLDKILDKVPDKILDNKVMSDHKVISDNKFSTTKPADAERKFAENKSQLEVKNRNDLRHHNYQDNRSSQDKKSIAPSSMVADLVSGHTAQITPNEQKLPHAIIEKPIMPIVERRNTIMDPVDLGELKMVATDPILAQQAIEVVVPINLNLKHYNDVIRVEPPLHNMEYELVETKL
jgi:Rne/Rng family ribonuclease